MSNKHSEQAGSQTSEYTEIFAKLAADDDLEISTVEITVETVRVEVEDDSTSDEEDALSADQILPPDTIDDKVNATEATEAAPEGTFAEEESVSGEELDAVAATPSSDAPSEADEVQITASLAELKPAIEAILFVADEPVPFNQLCKLLGDVNTADVYAAIVELTSDYEARNSGLEVREIAGGWRISTRPQLHEFIRKYLKSKPSARLSLPALETLAVIAYKQPITVPEVLEIRGVSSSSAIKTLLEKRLIVTKGRKETVGKPMMYGTSKEFLIQFGLRDLSELPSIEDFEELAA